MNWTHQKRAYKARLLQWNGINLSAVSSELRKLGYESFEIERGTIMARGKGMSLLCVHRDNWLRFGQNGSFKVMRPDEKETYVIRKTDNELRDENDRLLAANKDLQEWFDAAKVELSDVNMGIEAKSEEIAALRAELDAMKSQRKGMALVPPELTAENGAKSTLIGEKFAGENVSWSAIKEIHKAVVRLFDAQKGGV